MASTSRQVTTSVCDRCLPDSKGRVREATAHERMTIFGATWIMDLCEEHADRFRTDIWSWLRNAQEVPGFFQSPVTTEVSRKSTPIAALRAVPNPVELEEMEPTDGPSIVTEMRLQKAFKEWTFCDHALQRLEERDVSKHDALLACISPETVTTSMELGRQSRQRGNVIAVVAIDTHTVITVINTLIPVEDKVLATSAAR